MAAERVFPVPVPRCGRPPLAADERAIGEDRQRIARDLQDRVVRRLFATGLAAQSLRARVTDPDTGERLQHVVEELDRAILDLRSSIFDLDTPGAPDAAPSLRARVVEECTLARRELGVVPRVRFVGPVETAGHEEASHLVRALREALVTAGRRGPGAAVTIAVLADVALTLESGGDAGAARAERAAETARARAPVDGGVRSHELGVHPGGGS